MAPLKKPGSRTARPQSRSANPCRPPPQRPLSWRRFPWTACSTSEQCSTPTDPGKAQKWLLDTGTVSDILMSEKMAETIIGRAGSPSPPTSLDGRLGDASPTVAVLDHSFSSLHHFLWVTSGCLRLRARGNPRTWPPRKPSAPGARVGRDVAGASPAENPSPANHLKSSAAVVQTFSSRHRKIEALRLPDPSSPRSGACLDVLYFPL